MEIKGSKEELEKLFREKKRVKFKFPKIPTAYLMGAIFMCFIFIIFYLSWALDDNYLTKKECNDLIKERMNMNLDFESNLKAGIIAALPLLGIALAISWVIHGV